jgi:hypothetical protein
VNWLTEKGLPEAYIYSLELPLSGSLTQVKYLSNNAEQFVDLEPSMEKSFFPLEWVAGAIQAASRIAVQHEHLERLQSERLAALRPIPRLGRRA